MNYPFSGLTVALATPQRPYGDLDLDAFRRLVGHVVKNGADHLLVLGSTGEGALLTERERQILIETCLEESEDCSVVVGTGHSSTAEVVRQTRQANDLGCDGALVVIPPYVKPEARGIAAHFEAIADAVPKLPLIIYNVPGRTGRNLSPQALQRVWDNPNVVAVKESSGDVGQMGRIAASIPEGRTLLCGDDHLTLAAIAVGAQGLVSVIGNLLPAETRSLVEAARKGELDLARSLQRSLLPLMEALFLESNPIPLKAGLEWMGIAGDEVRLPLTRATLETRRQIENAVERLRVIDLPGGHYEQRAAISAL